MAEVFGGNFLMLISSVYFLQGLGAFATYVSQFYLMRSYEETCPCMLDDSCTGGPPDGCHMGLALQPSEQTAVLTFAKLPWNYKMHRQRLRSDHGFAPPFLHNDRRINRSLGLYWSGHAVW
jgi:hypothetical protein